MAGRGPVERPARLRRGPVVGRRCGPGGAVPALEQRPRRGMGQPAEGARAADVRSCQVRPAAPTRAQRRLNSTENAEEPPAQVRSFAKGIGVLGETDRIDAQLLARYGQLVRPRAWSPPARAL